MVNSRRRWLDRAHGGPVRIQWRCNAKAPSTIPANRCGLKKDRAMYAGHINDPGGKLD
jgi:hypothetical protein